VKFTKLFSLQYGSRLYGTSTPESDLDLKHVVLPELGDLLAGNAIGNVVKKTNNQANTRNSKDDVDEEFIPVQVFARDFFRGQTYALEIAYALEGTHCGQTFYSDIETPLAPSTYDVKKKILRRELPYMDPGIKFLEFTKELRAKFLTSNLKAMVGYAVGQAIKYSAKGERLNAARRVLAVLKDYADLPQGNKPFGPGQQRLAEIAGDNRFASMASAWFQVTEYDIGDGRMRPCFKLLEKTLPFTSTVDHTIGVVEAIIDSYGSRADAAAFTNADWKALMHALRITEEGLELLNHHFITFPRRNVEKLLEVKRGMHSFNDVEAEINAKVDQLKSLERLSSLPKHTPELQAVFNVWLTTWMKRFYGVK